MDIKIKKKYAVISYFIGDEVGDGIQVNSVDYLGRLLTCAVCDTPLQAIEEFEAKVNLLCWNKNLIDCMKSYHRNSDNVCRDMFLYTVDEDGRNTLCRVAIVLAGVRE